MPHNSPPTVVALCLLASLGLAACGDSTSQTARSAQLFKQQRAELLELVSCAHQHGIPLPPPTPDNRVLTRGVNLKSPRRKAALTACYQKTVKKAKETNAPTQTAQTPPGATRESAQGTAIFTREREQLMEVVKCARHRGIHLPEPDARNNVNTSGVNLQSPHNKAAMNICLHKVVGKASSEQSREQEQLARERETGPRRLGEEPPG